AAVVSFPVWVVYSVAFLLLDVPWSAPIPIYLEHALFPLYLAAAFVGYWGILRAVALLIACAAAVLVGRFGALRLRPKPAPLSAQSTIAKTAWPSATPWLAAATCLAGAIVPAKTLKYPLPDGRGARRARQC